MTAMCDISSLSLHVLPACKAVWISACWCPSEPSSSGGLYASLLPPTRFTFAFQHSSIAINGAAASDTRAYHPRLVSAVRFPLLCSAPAAVLTDRGVTAPHRRGPERRIGATLTSCIPCRRYAAHLVSRWQSDPSIRLRPWPLPLRSSSSVSFKVRQACCHKQDGWPD